MKKHGILYTKYRKKLLLMKPKAQKKLQLAQGLLSIQIQQQEKLLLKTKPMRPSTCSTNLL